MLETGLVQVYTFNSGNFNFAPLGLALRASGQGFRSLICSFTTHELMDEAVIASSILSPNIILDHSAIAKGTIEHDSSHSLKDRVNHAFYRAKASLISEGYDIVILNGIHQMVRQGMIPLQEVLTLIDTKPPNVELILSGEGADPQTLEKADLVTEMVVRPSKGSLKQENDLKDNGSIDVITGNGKGKTTYCLGKAMLLSCRGIRALIVQFIKSSQRYGEVIAIERLPFLEISSMGEGFVDLRPVFREKHKDAAQKAWKFLLGKNSSQKYNLLVLDEINVATGYGLIATDQVIEYLSNKPRDLNLLLSGRNASEKIVEVASKVIEMKEIKHPFRQGIKARKGIEY